MNLCIIIIIIFIFLQSLERMVVQKEEKYQRDFNSANLEKTRLQSIVRLQEAQARETKSRLDQWVNIDWSEIWWNPLIT